MRRCGIDLRFVFHSDALTSQIIDNMLVGNDLNAIAN